MVRKHKSEHQRPVSEAKKEESGASKRKRQLERDKDLDSCRTGLAKFLRGEPQAVAGPSNVISVV